MVIPRSRNSLTSSKSESCKRKFEIKGCFFFVILTFHFHFHFTFYFPLVDDTVVVAEEHLLLKSMEGLVQLEPGVARGESGDKNIGLGPFRGVVLDAGVNSFQNVVGT